MNHKLSGIIDTYCYLVERGKPLAVLAVKVRDLELCKERVNECGFLQFYHKNLSEGWVSFFIFKEEYMKEVIHCLPEKPKTNYDHWVLGKAFGYSDEAIRDYLLK